MVFVLNKDQKPLNPCHPAKARWLLKNGYAVVHRRFPFVIRLKEQVEAETKEYILKIDPGAKYSGVAIVENCSYKAKVAFLATIQHRIDIKAKLDTRRAMRRARRSRKTRYRAPRFLNRTRKEGWLPPSVQSIVDNIETWTMRFLYLCPISKIAVETVRFDTQLLENPDISGAEYQQGTLYGTELREYLLYKSKHTCQYCHGLSEDKILELEHMVSKRNGGSDRLKNLTIACHACNQEKASLNLDQWSNVLKQSSKSKLNQARIESIEKILSSGLPNFLKVTAKVNSSRKAIYRVLAKYTDALEVSSGGITKFNRTQANLPKEHYYDALCVGSDMPDSFTFPKDLKTLLIKASGRGSMSRTNLDKYGFPRSYLPREKIFFGFKSGDLVKAIVLRGKHEGVWIGKVAVRKTGSFKLYLPNGTSRDGINHKYCSIVQLADGYNYDRKDRALSSPLLRQGASCA